MPFMPPNPRPFNARAVQDHAPQQSGVYGISNASSWIYIGETDNIQRSLLERLASDHGTQLRNPSGFVFEICHPALRADRQNRLVMEYEPSGNRQWNGAR
jgi:hypothetical protein